MINLLKICKTDAKNMPYVKFIYSENHIPSIFFCGDGPIESLAPVTKIENIDNHRKSYKSM